MTRSIPSCSWRLSQILKAVRSFPDRAACARCAGVSAVGANAEVYALSIIYYLRTRQGQIWMLTLYRKNVAENISAQVLKQIKEEIDG